MGLDNVSAVKETPSQHDLQATDRNDWEYRRKWKDGKKENHVTQKRRLLTCTRKAQLRLDSGSHPRGPRQDWWRWRSRLSWWGAQVVRRKTWAGRSRSSAATPESWKRKTVKKISILEIPDGGATEPIYDIPLSQDVNFTNLFVLGSQLLSKNDWTCSLNIHVLLSKREPQCENKQFKQERERERESSRSQLTAKWRAEQVDQHAEQVNSRTVTQWAWLKTGKLDDLAWYTLVAGAVQMPHIWMPLARTEDGGYCLYCSLNRRKRLWQLTEKTKRALPTGTRKKRWPQNNLGRRWCLGDNR